MYVCMGWEPFFYAYDYFDLDHRNHFKACFFFFSLIFKVVSFFFSTCSPQSPSWYQLAPPHIRCEYNKSITVPNLTLQNQIYLPQKSEAGGDLENVCQNNAKYWYSGTCNTSVETVGLVCVKFSVNIYYVWVLTPVRTTCE